LYIGQLTWISLKSTFLKALRLSKGDVQSRIGDDIALARLNLRLWRIRFEGLYAHLGGSRFGPWEIDDPVWSGEDLTAADTSSILSLMSNCMAIPSTFEV
jgi:hypothetical protein